MQKRRARITKDETEQRDRSSSAMTHSVTMTMQLEIQFEKTFRCRLLLERSLYRGGVREVKRRRYRGKEEAGEERQILCQLTLTLG